MLHCALVLRKQRQSLRVRVASAEPTHSEAVPPQEARPCITGGVSLKKLDLVVSASLCGAWRSLTFGPCCLACISESLARPQALRPAHTPGYSRPVLWRDGWTQSLKEWSPWIKTPCRQLWNVERWRCARTNKVGTSCATLGRCAALLETATEGFILWRCSPPWCLLRRRLYQAESVV